MKLSEFINRLKNTLDKTGDVDIYIYEKCSGRGFFRAPTVGCVIDYDSDATGRTVKWIL